MSSAVDDFSAPTLEAPIRKNSLDQLNFFGAAMGEGAGMKGGESDGDKTGGVLAAPSYSVSVGFLHLIAFKF